MPAVVLFNNLAKGLVVCLLSESVLGAPNKLGFMTVSVFGGSALGAPNKLGIGFTGESVLVGSVLVELALRARNKLGIGFTGESVLGPPQKLGDGFKSDLLAPNRLVNRFPYSLASGFATALSSCSKYGDLLICCKSARIS